MTRDEVIEKYGELLADYGCVEAYVGRDGAFYYRYDAAYPVTEPGQISFNKVIDGADPVPCTTVEFHEAQKGDKLK